MSVHSPKKIFCGNFDFFLELLVNQFFVLFQSNPVGRKQIFVEVLDVIILSHKAGSKEHGEGWQKVTETLNTIE